MATRIFGKEKQRPSWHPSKTPGPGSYVPPSDFGYVTLSPRAQVMQAYAFNNSYKSTTPRLVNSILLKKQEGDTSEAGRSTQLASTNNR